MKPNLMIAAGGTGGHIFPALAVANQLTAKFNIIWVGGIAGLENQIVPEAGYRLERIKISGIRNKGLLKKLLLPIILLRALLSSAKLILKYRPQVVVGFGGYASFPICLAAKLLGKPIIIHEQNSVAGLSNRILAKLANYVLTAFPNVLPSSKTVMTGNPVRSEIIEIGAKKVNWPVNLSNNINKNNHDSLRILIIGGSLGAKVLNEVVPLAIAKSSRKFAKITHQAGRNDVQLVSKLYDIHRITAEIVPFIKDMALAYANADLVICRAGALTIAEIAASSIAAIFVPYPYAVDDHQATNAKYLVDNKAALLILQSELTGASLSHLIDKFSLDELRQMGAKAHTLAIIDSTEQICNRIMEFN